MARSWWANLDPPLRASASRAPPSSGPDRWPDQPEPLENLTDIAGEHQAHGRALTAEEARVRVQPPGPRPVTLVPREAAVNRPERADSHVRRAHDRQRPAIAAEHDAPVARPGQRLVPRRERLHELRRRPLGTVQHQEGELVGQLRGVAEREGRVISSLPPSARRAQRCLTGACYGPSSARCSRSRLRHTGYWKAGTPAARS